MPKRILKGRVVSAKMKDTVVVAVTRLEMHPKYRKTVKVTRKYHAHYTGGDVSVGDRVVIEESRPISKTKKWILIKSEARSTKSEIIPNFQ